VLTVDDDDLLQEAMAMLLDGLGHQQVVAMRGEDALALLAEGHRPDVVILDMNMPGLGGAKTLAHLRQLRPAVPVLLATSRVDTAIFDLLNLYPGVRLLSKPFTSEDLRRKLDEVVLGSEGS
jgi:CheY-like chemotaxis protein